MHALRFRLAILSLILIGLPLRSHAQQAPQADAPSVGYHVAVNLPARTFLVTGTLNNIQRDTIIFHFPIWGPGAYDIMNFGGYVSEFTATSSTGRGLKVVRADTSTFLIIGRDRAIHIAYHVHDIGFTQKSLWFGLSDIEKDFAFANTPALFGYPDGYKDIPYGVGYEPPKGWDLAVALDPAAGRNNFLAHDYDELIDAPVQMGKFQRIEVMIKGKPHIITVTAPRALSAKTSAQLVEATRKSVTIISDFFGDMPYNRYLFQHFLVEPKLGDNNFGALEHRNSSTYRMPLEGAGTVAELLPVIAHEYWHLWSPKRAHVTQLGPFDYQSPPRTASLWFAEGLTEYYAQMLLRRNGLASSATALAVLSQEVSVSRGRKQGQPIADLSMKISEVPIMEILPLYTKGPLIGLLLDAAIRSQTGNAKSLDDAMRYFNQEYGKTGKTFTDQEIIPIMERATGARLSEFHDRYIAGTDPLPFDQYLPTIGLKIITEYKEKPTLGGEYERADSGWRIVALTPGGSADKMGMRVGDVITDVVTSTGPIDPRQVQPEYVDVIATLGDVTGFTFIRDGERKTVGARISIGKVASVRVILDPDATDTAVAARIALIGM
ncbi:MAG: hypothetical protein ABIR47_07260 [Candidatus Kapaibacterium sp.]